MTTASDFSSIPNVGDHRGVSPVFRMPIIAQAHEIDELGHVSNIQYLRWVQDAAMAHSAFAGWDRPRYAEEGSIFVVRKHEITYYTSAKEGDTVSCFTWVDSWRGASSPRCTMMIRDSDGANIATCITLWAFIDSTSGRPRRIPKELLDNFRDAKPSS